MATRRFVETVVGRATARLCAFLMVFQGMPIWEIARAHSVDAQQIATLAHQGAQLFLPAVAYAASPVADAGPDQIVAKDSPNGALVGLDGTGSFDPDGDTVNFRWFGPFGSTTGTSPVVAVPEGRYTTTLRVDDGSTSSAPDTALVEVAPCFALWEARAKRGKVQLTWPDQGAPRYDIYRSSEAAPSQFVKVGETTSTYSTFLDFTVTNEVSYLYQVLAVGAGGDCFSDVLAAHPTALRARVNYDPIIYSSPVTTATTGLGYNYDVNAADPNGDALGFALGAAPAGMSIDPFTGLITWTPLGPGAVNVTVVASDGLGGSDSQSFLLDAANPPAANRPPVADAGPDQTAFVGDTVTLDGGGSTDVDGDPLTFTWSLTSVPPGGTAALSDPAAVMPTFDIDLPGTYVAQLIVNDGSVDSAPDTVTVTTQNSAPVADAGPDQTAFVGDTVTLDGGGSTDVDGDPLTFDWSLTSVPPGSAAALPDPTAVMPTFDIDLPGAYDARLIVNDGFLDSAPDTVTVTTQNSAPVANAGPNQTAFVGDTVTLDGGASSDVDGDPLTFSWSLTAKPAGSAAALSDPTAVMPTFDVDLPGTYVAQLIVNDGTVDSAPDTVTVATQNSAPVADAGPDQTAFVGDTVTLDGGGSTDVDGDPLTFAWSLTSVPPGSTAALSDPAAVMPTFDIDLPGTYVAQLIVNDGSVDSAPDTVTVTTQNSAPVANAGPDQNVTQGDTVQLDGSQSNDADLDPLTYSWSLTAKPVGSTAALSSPVAIAPTFVADLPGIYVAQLIVNDGTVDSAPDTVTVDAAQLLVAAPDVIGLAQAAAEAAILAAGLTVGAIGTANSATVPAGNVISQNPTAGTNVPAASAVDLVVSLGPALVAVPDVVGLAQAAAESAIVAAGLSVGTVGTANSAAVPAGNVISQNPAAGANVAAASAVDLVVSLGPAVVAGPDTEPPSLTVALDRNPPIYDQGDTAILSVNASDNAGPPTLAALLDGVNLPIAPGDTPIDTSGFGLGTTHTLRITTSDSAGNETIRTLLFTVRDPADGTPPTVALTSPADDATLTAPTDVIGTANDTNLAFYELQLAPKGSGQFSTFVTGTTAVVGNVLGQLDTTLVESGMYDLRLRAEDANGNSATTGPVTVLVEGEGKSGNVSVTFTDLHVPVAGIPITINRSYDSRRRGLQGDFGFGWELEVLQEADYLNNRQPGDGWQILPSGGFISLPCRTVSETKTHITEIRFSDTEFYRFKLDLASPFAIGGGCLATASFSQIGGVPGASLAILGDTDVFWQNGSNEVLDFTTFAIYEPEDVRLTRLDGTQFQLNINTGLNRIADTNGNALNITSSGVTHSSGKSIAFGRDAQGRITSITDPLGRSLTYAYDADGNLAGATNRAGNTTQFVYNFGHFLRDIVDSTGQVPQRNVYDASGRLVAYLDADGNRIDVNTVVATNTTEITNKGGVLTSLQYNGQGQVTQASAGGETIQATYDARGNKLSQTDVLGNTTTYTFDAQDNLLTQTDPLGNTVTRTYNALGKVLAQTDPNGNTTTRTYNAAGNVLTITDPLGGVTTFTYNASGKVLTETDPLGNTTTATYDAFGNMLSTTDPLGNTTAFTYDAIGNRLTKTDALGNTWTFAYDGNDNVTQETDPLGNIKTWAYDGNDRVISQTDANGNTTTTQYDKRGNETRKNYPDGTAELFVYDANDRRTGRTDRGGRTQFFAYDGQDRLIETLFPDGALIKQEYDAGGRLIATIDPQGNRTEHTYDAAGRRIGTTDALGNLTTFAYDASGNQTSTTDANGNTTQYDYDALRRLVRTTFPDATQKTIAYDLKGQKISETDEAGNTTLFEYDALGRLTKATDALGGQTTYAYDAVGNRISQTDANGNTTTFAYDALGRLTGTTRPLAMSKTMAYDAIGNVVSTTDFNGDTTSFVYDVSNRLVQTNLPGGLIEDFTYSPTGKRLDATDARGVTAYEYDVRDRLTRRTDPDGTVIDYTYDLAGNRTRATTPVGDTDFTYDALNRLATVTDPNGGVSTYAYDAVGNRASLTYANGNVTTYTYDSRNRLTLLETRTGLGALIASYSYTLGSAGNRTQVVENTGRTVDYTYDALYRLTREDITDAVLGNSTTDYAYDAVGNRLTKTVGLATTTYTYDANDRMLTENGTTYTYDANGNQLSKNGTTYQYDGRNRLVQVDDGVDVTAYAYDTEGFRVQSIVNGATVTNFLVDHNRTLPQVLRETDGGGIELVSYVYGDDLLSQQRGGTAASFQTDGQMSTRQLTDAAGNVTDTYVYDAFGVLLGSTGATANSHRYTAQYQDANSGFYYLRARWLNPALGIFTSTDPVAGNVFEPPTLHRYTYALNDPVNLSDPSGRQFSLGGMMAAVSISSILVSIMPSITVGIATAALIKTWWEPGFEMRYGGIALIASGGPDVITALGYQLYLTGNAFIEIGAVLIEFTKALIDMTFAFTGLAGSINNFATSANAIAGVANSVLLLNDIASLVGKVGDLTTSLGKLQTALTGQPPKSPPPPAAKDEAKTIKDIAKEIVVLGLKIASNVQ